MADKTMKEIYEGVINGEFQEKLAYVEKAYEGDTDRQELLERAVDIVKEATDSGDLPVLHPSAALSLAVELVEQTMLEKEAAAWEEIGTETGQALAMIGITPEDINKIASQEEAEEFVRLSARLWYSIQTGEDHLSNA
jgi:hypothetical protein